MHETIEHIVLVVARHYGIRWQSMFACKVVSGTLMQTARNSLYLIAKEELGPSMHEYLNISKRKYYDVTMLGGNETDLTIIRMKLKATKPA